MLPVTILTRPFAGQTMGTSGLRKKTKEIQQPLYVENFFQAIFNALPPETNSGELVIGGDGRFYNKEAIQMLLMIAAANGVTRVCVGRGGLLSTPAVSRLVRSRGASGAIILTASHNPGGPNGDFGIKYNCANGGPAPPEITLSIEKAAACISNIKVAKIDTVDLTTIGTRTYGTLTVEIVDSAAEYVRMCTELFDIDLIKAFVAKHKPRVLIDCLHAVSGVYVRPVFCDLIGLPESSLRNATPLEDFGGHHPDPNLTYAKDLVDLMFTGEYDLGVAFDGDADRNLILGNKFFVTPSDSLAVLTAQRNTIKYFREKGFHGVARSMPTSTAVDAVVQKEKEKENPIPFAETPTGWKFFGNLMDAGRLSLCGEESFGTGCDEIREKDGLWAALAWLSVLANANTSTEAGSPLVSIGDIVRSHWHQYGRNYYSRYDYEEVDSNAANTLMDRIRTMISDGDSTLKGLRLGGKALLLCDDFCYTDPVDKSVVSKQGLRFLLEGDTRVLVRLSGTGSSGATIRVYFDMRETDRKKLDKEANEVLADLIKESLKFIQIEEITGRKEPTVIT